jgi:hypothetical protein
MEPPTRSQQRVLDALVTKLETLSPDHPDRPNLMRTILGLRRKLAASPQGNLLAGLPVRARHRRRLISAIGDARRPVIEDGVVPVNSGSR